MKKTVLIIFGLLFLISGCSDKSADNSISEGDYTNEDYLLVRVEADSVIEDFRFDNFGARDWICRVPNGPQAPHIDSVNYDSTTGWHVWEFSREDSIIQLAVVDSFRFTDINSQYQYHRDSTTDMFERRLNKDLHVERDRTRDGSEWTRTLQRNATWSGLADTVTSLNGDFSRYWVGEGELWSFEKTTDGEMVDILFHTDDLRRDRPAHPFDGTFEAWMVMDVLRGDRQVHIESHLIVTFFDGGFHARLERGDRFWEWTRYWRD